MVMIGTLVVLAIATATLARPDRLDDQLGLFSIDENDFLLSRAVANPKTPNQILDSIAEEAVEKIRESGWDASKRIQNGYSTIPFEVNSGGSSSETFSITSGSIIGLNSLRRSKSASFNTDKSELTGTLIVENICASADYTVSFAGEGEAPAQTVKGTVTECVDKLFADIAVGLEDLVPQNIQSYSVRSGHDQLDISNMEGNKMANVHEAGIRKSLRQHLEKVMATNVKVKINQAIQDIKAEATEKI